MKRFLAEFPVRARPGLAPGLAVASGLLLLPLLSFLDRLALGGLGGILGGPTGPAGLLAPALVEEAGKFLLVLAFTALATPRPRGAALSIVAIVIFSALENLAYQRSFPGTPVFGRLLWASPVHLVSALAFASALGAPAGRGRNRAGPAFAAASALALLLALAWHLGANALASRNLDLPLFLAGCLANAAAIAALARLYFLRVVIAEPPKSKGTSHE